MYIHKHTTELSAADCRDLKSACTHARELRQPLNTLGKVPHVHVFMHCPPRLRDELNRALVGLYPAGVIDVREGGDIRRLHHPSGFFGSALDYLMRFKSQQAYVADGGRTWRASVKLTVIDAKTGRARTINRGIKSPITGKRWGRTRNISPRAIGRYLEAKSAARAEAKAA